MPSRWKVLPDDCPSVRYIPPFRAGQTQPARFGRKKAGKMQEPNGRFFPHRSLAFDRPGTPFRQPSYRSGTRPSKVAGLHAGTLVANPKTVIYYPSFLLDAIVRAGGRHVDH